MSIFSTQTGPRAEVIDYTLFVPFKNNLVVTSHRLTANDELVPATGPTGGYPVAGSTTFYRLIGDGSHIPTFDSAFKKISGAEYVALDGFVNLIVFQYTGLEFLYEIFHGDLPAPVWPHDVVVGDFGLGAVLSFVVAPQQIVASLQIVEDGGSPQYAISMFDLLTSVHYIGTETLTYSLSKDGMIWSESTDPKQSYVVYDCADIIAVPPFHVDAYIMISDGTLTQSIVIPVYVQDPFTLCIA